MGGFVWAVRSGLVWPPWKEEVLVDAPKRSVYQLSLWLSCHIPLAVGGLFLALSMHELRLTGILRTTSPFGHSRKFAFKEFSEVRRYGVLGSSFTSRAALSLSWCSEVFLCYSAHTFTLNKSTLRLLRELWTPREGSGQR